MKKSKIGHIITLCFGLGLFMYGGITLFEIPNENITKSDTIKVTAFFFMMMVGLWITFSPANAFMDWLESKIKKKVYKEADSLEDRK